MDRAKAIQKIKKCLRLSKSSNPNEAAAALRHAQALMREHGIELADVEASEAAEARGRSSAARNPVDWEVALANMIKDCFACDLIFASGWDRGEYVFIGSGARPEIAAYAYAVLRRQARLARAQYIVTALRRCKPSNKTRRADEFCRGWISAVREKALALVPSQSEVQAIEAYKRKNYPATSELEGKTRSRGSLDDSIQGYEEGRKAQLHRGVDSESVQQLEHRT